MNFEKRSKENFKIGLGSKDEMPYEVVASLALLKRAVAMVNMESGSLKKEIGFYS